MPTSSTAHPNFISTLAPASGRSRVLYKGGLAVVGTLLLMVSAKIQIPFWPVPMTMQTFAVLVIGMAYGPRLGAATVLLYLAEGAFGIPVFAGTPEKGLGLAYMMGPTGGYLAGFVASAYVVGSLAEKGWDRGVIRSLAAMTIGTAVIFFCGLSWLSVLFGAGTAIQVGLIPFLPAAALKIALAAAILPAAWRVFYKP